MSPSAAGSTIRRSIAALLVAHAVAQLTGFALPRWVFDPLPSSTDGAAWAGDSVVRMMSIGWLAVALVFLVAAVEVLHENAIWRRLTTGAAVASLALSAICLPGSLLGIPINLAILALVRWGHGSPVRHGA